MNTQLKNIRTFKGHDGIGLTASLFIDGIKTANIYDAADGGSYRYDIVDSIRFNAFKSKLNECPSQFIPEYDMELKLDADLYICLLHAAQVNKSVLNLLN